MKITACAVLTCASRLTSRCSPLLAVGKQIIRCMCVVATSLALIASPVGLPTRLQVSLSMWRSSAVENSRSRCLLCGGTCWNRKWTLPTKLRLNTWLVLLRMIDLTLCRSAAFRWMQLTRWFGAVMTTLMFVLSRVCRPLQLMLLQTSVTCRLARLLTVCVLPLTRTVSLWAGVTTIVCGLMLWCLVCVGCASRWPTIVIRKV